MKRYLLFAGFQFVPYLGWHSFRGDFDTLEEADYSDDAIIFGREDIKNPRFYQVVDSVSQQVVKEWWG